MTWKAINESDLGAFVAMLACFGVVVVLLALIAS